MLKLKKIYLTKKCKQNNQNHCLQFKGTENLLINRPPQPPTLALIPYSPNLEIALANVFLSGS
jgi:hypothetical protein